MGDLVREFPCFSGFVIAALLVLMFFSVATIENVLLARLKVRGLVEIEKSKQGKKDADV